MTTKEKQWLLSLSLVSLLGATCDVDLQTDKGFYKKPAKGLLVLPEDMPVEGRNRELIESFLTGLDINSEESYRQRLDEILEGTGFSADMLKFQQLGKTMNASTRGAAQSYTINGHPYMYELLESLMLYEFHMPKHDFRTFDVANVIMLVRLGKNLGWMTAEEQSDKLEQIKPVAEAVFDSYKAFGQEAITCRSIACRFLEQIGSNSPVVVQKDVLSIAYHCLWQYMEE